jgi:hypothetical protein
MSRLPDYYRHLAERPATERLRPPVAGSAQAVAQPEAASPQRAEPVATAAFQADSFSIQLQKGWIDKTVYILAGPATDGVQHNITVSVDPQPAADRLIDFADLCVHTLVDRLKGCRLLHRSDVQLESGIPAHRAIFVWYPNELLRLYQEQLYVLQKDKGYALTASFTKKTRRTLGPKVERMMLSFTPRV